MADVLPFTPVAAVESDPTAIFRDGALSLWHSAGAEPVLVIDLGGDITATHSLSPEAVSALWRALLSTRMDKPLARVPVAFIPGENP